MEAMIVHSYNTGTDMTLKYIGPDKVRSFIASAGLRSTEIPDSTRSFFGYLLGAPDYKNYTWAEVEAAGPLPIVKPPLNSVETLASSADDFISYYSRALQGKLFNNAQTVNEFRRIPILADAIFLATLPLGGSAFAKGGSIDVPDFHCLCIPGGMFFNNHWVYFAFTINWHAAAETDPDTVAAFARSPTRPWSSCSTHFRFRKSPSAAREDVVLTHDCETFAKSIEECLGDGAVVFFVSLVLADCAPGPEITAHAHALAA